MDVALLLILPVIGGYYFANNWNFTRFHSVREEGHRLYFRAVSFGTLLFTAAYLLRLPLLHYLAWFVEFETTLRTHLAQFLKPPKDNPGFDGFPLMITSIYALLIGVLTWRPLNRLFPRDRLLKDAVQTDDFERLVHTAVEKDSPLLVTIDNGKVYVGFVIKTVDPSRDRKTLRILPVMSGYRQTNGSVQFTTYYERVYDEIEHGVRGRLPHLTPEDFEIVLPVERIVSANMFDILAYEEFGRRHRRRVAKSKAPRPRKRKQAKQRATA